MDDKKAEGRRKAPVYIFDCHSEPIPPGTKFTAKLPRGEEQFQEPSTLRWWLLGGGAVTAALFAGIVIGRFLLS